MREYESLRWLHEANLDIAPEPLWLDESCEVVPYPVVAYRWLDGQPLGPLLTDAQLAALLASVQLMHSLEAGQTCRLPNTWFHWFDFQAYLAELGELLRQYGPWLETADPQGHGLQSRMARLVDGYAKLVAATSVNPGRGNIALRICRADTNLANAIWNDDGRLRWVDWEYSGWGDPALELAEMRWHIAMVGLTEGQHIWLRQNYRRPPGDSGFEERRADPSGFQL